MTASSPFTATAFEGGRSIASGTLAEVALAVRRLLDSDPAARPLTFEDSTGRVVDLDLRGTPAEIEARYHAAPPVTPPQGRGRPRLGVVAREVTLLPRHWDWLSAQSGGASAALRRLVEQASREPSGKRDSKLRQEAAYRFLAAAAGDLPGFEEACRALFADDGSGFDDRAREWPQDLLDYARRLAWPEETAR